MLNVIMTALIKVRVNNILDYFHWQIKTHLVYSQHNSVQMSYRAHVHDNKVTYYRVLEVAVVLGWVIR